MREGRKNGGGKDAPISLKKGREFALSSQGEGGKWRMKKKGPGKKRVTPGFDHEDHKRVIFVPCRKRKNWDVVEGIATLIEENTEEEGAQNMGGGQATLRKGFSPSRQEEKRVCCKKEHSGIKTNSIPARKKGGPNRFFKKGGGGERGSGRKGVKKNSKFHCADPEKKSGCLGGKEGWEGKKGGGCRSQTQLGGGLSL